MKLTQIFKLCAKIAKKNFKLPLFSLKIYDTIKTLNIMLCCNLKNIIFVKVITCN